MCLLCPVNEIAQEWLIRVHCVDQDAEFPRKHEALTAGGATKPERVHGMTGLGIGARYRRGAAAGLSVVGCPNRPSKAMSFRSFRFFRVTIRQRFGYPKTIKSIRVR